MSQAPYTLSPQYPDWESFNPDLWWQTENLDPSWFRKKGENDEWWLGPPAGSMPSGDDWLTLDPGLYPSITGAEGRFDPWQTYQDYWAQDKDWRTALDAPFMSVDRARGTGTGRGLQDVDPWGPVGPPPFLSREDAKRFKQMRGEVTGLLEDRMSPDYSQYGPEIWGPVRERAGPDFTMWSPEQRAASDRAIGGQLAVARGDIGDRMAARGIYGSGLQGQLEMGAAGQAARARTEAGAAFTGLDEQSRQWALNRLAGMEGQDEATRQWATQQLEDMRRYGVNNFGDLQKLHQILQIQSAETMGPTVLGGQLVEMFDPQWIAELSWESQKYIMSVQAAYDAGEVDETQALMTIFEHVTGGRSGGSGGMSTGSLF